MLAITIDGKGGYNCEEERGGGEYTGGFEWRTGKGKML